MNKYSVLRYLKSHAEDINNIDLLNQIEETRLEMEVARNFFENAQDEKLIEVAIHQEEAARKRYDFLILEARKNMISVSQEYIIDKSTELAE